MEIYSAMIYIAQHHNMGVTEKYSISENQAGSWGANYC